MKKLLAFAALLLAAVCPAQTYTPILNGWFQGTTLSGSPGIFAAGNFATPYNARAFGAKGNAVVLSFSAMTVNTTSYSSTSGSFVTGDAGKTILVWGAGPGGYGLQTTIAAVSSSSLIQLTASASTGVTSSSTSEAVYGTDDTAAIQAMLNAMPAGSAGYFPGANAGAGNTGWYLVAGNSLSVSQQVSLFGDGTGYMNGTAAANKVYGPVQGASVIVNTSSTATGLVANWPGGVISNLSFINETGDVPTAGTGILYQNGQFSITSGVLVDGYFNGRTYSESALAVGINNFTGDYVGSGLIIAANANGDNGDSRWTNERFNSNQRWLTRTASQAVEWLSGGGAFFSGLKINGIGNVGFHVQVADGVNTQQIYVEDSSIEGTYNYPVFIEQSGVANTGVLNKLTFLGNEIAGHDVGFGVTIKPQTAGDIGEITITGNSFGVSAGGIYAKNTYLLNIGPNTIQFDASTSTSTPIEIDTGVTSYSVAQQVTTGNLVNLYADNSAAASAVGGGLLNPLVFSRTVAATTTSAYTTQFAMAVPDAYLGTMVQLDLAGSIGGVGAYTQRTLWSITTGGSGDATATQLGATLSSSNTVKIQAVTAGLNGTVRFQTELGGGNGLYGTATMTIIGLTDGVGLQ